LLKVGPDVLPRECTFYEMFGNAFDKTGPSDTASTDLGACNMFSFQHQDINAVFGQQFRTGKAARSGTDYNN
jgi:hypothetical protein